MNEHVTDWLGAYHDGELHSHRLQQVEVHLNRCQVCRAELQKLRGLSALLQECSVPVLLTSPNRFVSQVGLRLPRRPSQPAWKALLETGWRLTPALLLGAWAFMQAVFAVASAILYALQSGAVGDVVSEWLPPLGTPWLARIASLSGTSLEGTDRLMLQVLSSLTRSTVLNMFLLIVIGLLYWSWLASWWARSQHRNGETM